MTQDTPPATVLKRLVDVLGALVGLVVFAPLMAGVAIAIRVSIGHPVLFRQPRPGLHGEPFEIIKFRTMRPVEQGESLFRSDSDRVTPLGSLLRRLSIDELPELVNVLRGDMSLVGPRPLMMEYLPKYSATEARRHDVRPGVTGLAQVSGGEYLPFSEKLRLDVWYVDNRSWALDAKILLRTVSAVFQRKGTIEDLDEVDDIGLAPDRERRHDDET